MIFDHKRFVLRVVVFFWLAGWYIKSCFFLPYLFRTVVDYPIVISFFSTVLADSLTARILYLLPLCVIPCVFARDKQFFKTAGIIMIICSLGMLFHNDTYNDATFVTSFWTSLWIFWFIVNANRQDDHFYYHAGFLAQCLVGMIFLGGFIGKLTFAFWNGDIFFNIFFQQRSDALLFILNNYFSDDQLRILARYLARFVLCVEALLMCAPLWPMKVFVRIVPLIFLAFMITNTWQILSVLFSLIGAVFGIGLLIKNKKDLMYA